LAPRAEYDARRQPSNRGPNDQPDPFWSADAGDTVGLNRVSPEIDAAAAEWNTAVPVAGAAVPPAESVNVGAPRKSVGQRLDEGVDTAAQGAADVAGAAARRVDNAAQEATGKSAGELVDEGATRAERAVDKAAAGVDRALDRAGKQMDKAGERMEKGMGKAGEQMEAGFDAAMRGAAAVADAVEESVTRASPSPQDWGSRTGGVDDVVPGSKPDERFKEAEIGSVLVAGATGGVGR